MTERVRSDAPGMGTERNIMGSKVVETIAQSGLGHCSLDLICPTKLSRMWLSSLLRWSSQALAAAWSSVSSSPFSGFSTYGLDVTRLVSSCNASRRKVASSCESCWSYPTNCSAYLPRVVLKLRG